MRWDPEVESPATIAVIGAGPVGLEASLYARFLGYNVDIFDSGRPAKNASRWHSRLLNVPVSDCTTPLGHAALHSQDPEYSAPDANRFFTGQEFADEYLIPLAKSDLLVDTVHINSQVIEVSRLHTSLDDQADLQDRCNDEFRLLIKSRDRGTYTRRADIVFDCRGAMSGICGWGPAGSQTIATDGLLEEVHRWLPLDPRFELRSVQGKQTILFGQSDLAVRFAEEWSEWLENATSPEIAESLRRLAPLPSPLSPSILNTAEQKLDLKLIWLIPSISLATDTIVTQLAEKLAAKYSNPKLFSFLPIRGIERIGRHESGRWVLELLLADDSTVELQGDVFAPFPKARPTPFIGPELLSQDFAFRAEPLTLPADHHQSEISNWPGWRVATHEPHYYRLGSLDQPHDPKGLSQAYQQIRELFALLGTRANLDLYDIIEESPEPSP